MLQLKQITKDYVVADAKVHALKGVDIAFRRNEFVSVLGPSGCGKTTLLNIIGGLDHYTSGELFINGVSTVNYGDRDWDNYRNHSIGFVFQSYNLIPHQTISENVELALSISGVDKAERVRRAHEALDKVGLQGQYNKKPNQLSGGQCQRVAIARAIVNEPEILLADEPTGALDTTTSVQIMDIIKEIAEQRLVIMVTHNPELAEQYSTRIIRLLDGNIVDDTNPFGAEELAAQELAEAQARAAMAEQTAECINAVEQAESETITASDGKPKKTKKKKVKNKKSKLSFWGAFKLSARNLMSKFRRTFLVCLAGSIGIIGVATVLAVSSGVQGYIRGMQDDMLSGNPVTISQEAINMDAIMTSMNNMMVTDAVKPAIKDGYVNVDKIVEYLVARGNDMASMYVTNDITKEYVSYVNAMPKEYYSALVKSYGINLSNNLYTDFTMYGEDGQNVVKNMSLSAINTLYSAMLNEMPAYKQYAAYISMFTESFRIAPDNADYILSQYDMLGTNGKIATEADEIMLVVSKDTTLTDLLLAQFGYYSQDEFMNLVDDAVRAEEDKTHEGYRESISYEDLLGKTFTWYPNDSVYNKNGERFTYNNIASDDWSTGKNLKITAILRPKQSISYGCLSSGIYYTSKLADEALKDGKNSEIVRYLNEKDKYQFSFQYDKEFIQLLIDFKNGDYSALIKINEKLKDSVSYGYSFVMKDAAQASGYRKVETLGFVGSVDTMKAMMGAMTGGSTAAEYTLSLRHLGGIDLPSRIAVYPLSFDDKDLVTDYLKEWNADKTITVNGVELPKNDVLNDKGEVVTKGRSEITHTDNLEIVITLINQFINIITIALVCFTALSLVVSTVMIAIITYVSVIERIKEIGVIRSLGGRKRDASRLFNAETFIIGGISGLIGIAVTYGISGIINLILGSLFGIYTIAALPVVSAIIMIAVSIGLTLISGLIPASLAAKKDPVESLRTE